MSTLWQHPYVNIFKHLNIKEWKKCTKEGDVSTIMDKQVKCTVYRITGSIPAGNYIQFPRTTTQSLGLTGRFLYLLFRPVPTKYFVVHIDVATEDGLTVRVSFSNLFKEFKSTSTWLQFPFVSSPPPHSVDEVTSHGVPVGKLVGTSSDVTRWTVLVLDFHYILSVYLNRHYAYMKNIRLCANIFVKGIFTSDIDYTPGVSASDARKLGLIQEGFSPMPKEMAFPLSKGDDWHHIFDHIKFPPNSKNSHFGIMGGVKGSNPKVQHGVGESASKMATATGRSHQNRSQQSSRQAVNSRVALVDKLSPSKSQLTRKVRHVVPTDLPTVDLQTAATGSSLRDKGDVHVYAHPKSKSAQLPKDRAEVERAHVPKTSRPKDFKSLKPDPILSLKRIVGFGGATYRDALWTKSGASIVYPCHAIIVSMEIATGQQKFFMGHTDKVSCLTFDSSTSVLASAQTGSPSVVRIWKYHSHKCAAMFRTQVHNMHCLSFSHSGHILCGVGKDGHGKQMVVVWDTSQAIRGGEVSVVAKAHTEADICRMRIAEFDDSRMISCGNDNIRFWRIRHGSLRSCPVHLGQHGAAEFTDIVFGARKSGTIDPEAIKIYSCTKLGTLFQIDYQKIVLENVIRLLPSGSRRGPLGKYGGTTPTEFGIGINALSVTDSFCVTGSDDGVLRVWPLDFSSVFLEAEHEGPVTAVGIAAGEERILAGTNTGNLGVLDVSSRRYTTLMRSHTDTIHAVSFDPVRRHLATVSSDRSIRVWDLDTLAQLFDFHAPGDVPCAMAFHPARQRFACGFTSGCVRVFDVDSTSLLAEHTRHLGKVNGLAFSQSGEFLYSAGSKGTVALYDASSDDVELIRALPNAVAPGDHLGPHVINVSADSLRLAFVGPSEHTVTVANARTLDEVLRVDVTAVTSDRTAVDSALHVCYAPPALKQLLVVTSSARLLKLDAHSGLLLSEVSNIHRSECTSLNVSSDGRFLATAGDRVVKIWDYHMRMDLNFQVFIGHSEPVRQLSFTPDSLGLVSVGDAILLWDFLASRRQPQQAGGREPPISYIPDAPDRRVRVTAEKPLSPARALNAVPSPPRSAPVPTRFEPLELDISPMPPAAERRPDPGTEDATPRRSAQPNYRPPRTTPQEPGHRASQQSALGGGSSTLSVGDLGPSSLRGSEMSPSKPGAIPDPVSINRLSPAKQRGPGFDQGDILRPKAPWTDPCHPPNVFRHYRKRPRASSLAHRRYVAPPNQAGLRLKSVLGYNGAGRANMIWKYDTGLFAYTSGCVVVVEDLHSGSQRHLQGHTEEVSTLALQHDGLVLASASGPSGGANSQICLWNVQEAVCKKVLSHHVHEVVCLAYSRDDRFLISVSDYRECSVAVWSTRDLVVLTASCAPHPIHDLRWDPYTANEFVSVGQAGSVLFWLLDETGSSVTLNLHEPDIPEELVKVKAANEEIADLTSVCFSGDSVMYIGTSTGILSAWDTRQNKCFMHWEADTAEICVLIGRAGSLIAGGSRGSLRLWTVVGVGEMKLPGDNCRISDDGLLMEDEMTLDGAIASACFDDALETGIVGTAGGTLWYINWTERTSIRLVSSHAQQIKAVVFSGPGDQYFATCSDDGILHLWSEDNLEHLQFQVMGQTCNCMAFCPVPPAAPTKTVTNEGQTVATVHPQPKPADTCAPPSHCVAGYSDGTVRLFDLGRVEMIMKMQPHACATTAIAFSADGRVIMSAGSDGLIAISSPSTGLTLRVLNDHRGAPITDLHVSTNKLDHQSALSSPLLWLAASADRRVSVWSADWSKDFCELVDWLSFPAPPFGPHGQTVKKSDPDQFSHLPPSLARFSPSDPDIIIYTGYGMQKLVQFYSLSQKKVVRTAPITHWVTSMDVSPKGHLIVLGTEERLVKLMDYSEGSFQDFVGHCDDARVVRFSPSGQLVYSAGFSDILVWQVQL